MEVLTGASKVRIGRGNFSNVGRDQVNNYTIVQTRDKRTKVDSDPPELSEYTEIKRGDIFKDKDICYSWQLCSNGKDDTEAAVYIAQIMIGGRFGESKYTVKTYHGRNAAKEWRRDFSRCSMDWLRDVPLFGYNKSSVPLLIFCGELVPVAHIEDGLGDVGLFYIELLRNSLRCSRNELWMDPMKGRFCRGPIGPKCFDWQDVIHDALDVPSDVEFLKEAAVIRYLSSKEEDRWFLAALSYSSHLEILDGDIPAPSRTHVISGLTNSTIASFNNIRWKNWNDCLGKRQQMPNGVASYHFRDDRRKIEVESVGERNSWLTQALSVFHAHDISLDEDLSTYKFAFPFCRLTGTIQKSSRKRQRRQLFPPIYLIFFPTRTGTPLYRWSFNPTGQTPLLPEMCKYLGLPFKLSLEVTPCQSSWPTRIYRHIHDHQITRKFNPKTTGFARSLQFPIFKVAPAESRFREIVEEHHKIPIEPKAKPLPRVNTSEGLSEPVPDWVEGRSHEETDDSFSLEVLFDETEGSTKHAEITNSVSPRKDMTRSLLSTLFALFTWEAIEGSGISAAAI
ncbi:hypothetical protein E1B28_011650 [Marasmius oreades]|uniref:Uncharacterized protein n=1 Tax=Marasmius oreades TaxID=181124 RepID=A0A9P7RUQ0_9AGAR|nr:uncharacterized protein E1B28_011650 [Marasmius oreades]KAG7090030.1 hypothetical protein E1B28_011650 [Marasmius oreades]